MRRRRNRAAWPVVWLLAVALAMPAGAQTPVIPAPAPAKDAQASGNGTAPSFDAKPTRAGQPVVESLFFTREEMAQIRAAIEVYVRYAAAHGHNTGSEAEDFINELVGVRKSAQGGQYYYYPQFFLEALVYHSPNDWMVRINRQEFTPASTSNSRLRIKDIDADKVIVEWHPGEMDLIDRSWDKSSNKEVMVDDGSGTVTFTLRPNQTFSSYVMRPLEGKVLPVAITNAVNAAPLNVMDEKDSIDAPSSMPPSPAPPPPAAAAAPVPPAPPPDDRGLGGLINSYQRGAQLDRAP